MQPSILNLQLFSDGKIEHYIKKLRKVNKLLDVRKNTAERVLLNLKKVAETESKKLFDNYGNVIGNAIVDEVRQKIDSFFEEAAHNFGKISNFSQLFNGLMQKIKEALETKKEKSKSIEIQQIPNHLKEKVSSVSKQLVTKDEKYNDIFSALPEMKGVYVVEGGEKNPYESNAPNYIFYKVYMPKLNFAEFKNMEWYDDISEICVRKNMKKQKDKWKFEFCAIKDLNSKTVMNIAKNSPAGKSWDKYVDELHYAVDLLTPHPDLTSINERRNARCLSIAMFETAIVADTLVAAKWLMKRGYPGGVICFDKQKNCVVHFTKGMKKEYDMNENFKLGTSTNEITEALLECQKKKNIFNNKCKPNVDSFNKKDQNLKHKFDRFIESLSDSDIRIDTSRLEGRHYDEKVYDEIIEELKTSNNRNGGANGTMALLSSSLPPSSSPSTSTATTTTSTTTATTTRSPGNNKSKKRKNNDEQTPRTVSKKKSKIAKDKVTRKRPREISNGSSSNIDKNKKNKNI